MTTEPILAWHFVGDKLRNGDPIPPDGETLHYDRPLEMCKSGLHASVRIIDALQYAPGNTVCRVECGGEIILGLDKLICRERTILWRVEAESILWTFSRQQALGVIHLWNAPSLVRQYLETGQDDLRAAAYVVARDVARAVARAAASAAARDAAWAAARAAARAAASDAAWAAASDAAWAAASAAACVVARDAARDAASAAARAAASDAAWAAARDAARAAANKMLETMITEARK